ncbi:MAG: peptidoglycan-associated lipoprotein Pal [Gammaproteobacteria bacterium]
MQTEKIFKFGMAMLLTLTLAACASSDTDETSGSDVIDSSNSSSGSGSATSSGAGGSSSLTTAQMQERDAAMDTTVFYFEFDRSDLSAEARAALVYHANYLKDNPSTRYRLEGHADERGTREYNLALGERRAQAVERYLQVQGVSSNQLETISYGEENPVDPGTSEAAYSRNRRVEIH